MKGQVVRNAIDAHGWVGLIISVPLFIVFWAGAITLFYPEVQRWASMPQLPLSSAKNQSAAAPSLNALVEEKLQAYNFDNSRVVTLRLPTEYSPYIEMYIPVFDDPHIETTTPGSSSNPDNNTDVSDADNPEQKTGPSQPVSTERKTLVIDPHTGETLATQQPFQLANFLNRLHFTLKLPQGLYIVGIVTFFFMVLVFTGIVIQLKNMIRNFFLYRHKKSTRYQMNDMHNVVGVISLPYGLMYALTGLMFNLGILFQLPTALVLYQGDSQAMTRDAGFIRVDAKPAQVPAQMPDLDTLVSQVEADHNLRIHMLRLRNYQDENAIIRLRGTEHDSFAKRVELFYQVKTQDFPSELNPNLMGDNTFASGVRVLFNIHMANYAGVDLRFVYFLLAIGVCIMIVAGNVLWIAKRQKHQDGRYVKIIAITRGLTLGGCVGVVLASALAFLLERTLPVAYSERADLLIGSFGVALLASVLVAFFSRDYRQYLGYACLLSALLLLATFLVDAVWFGATLVELWQAGHREPGGLSLSLLVVMLLLAWLGRKTLRLSQKPAPMVAGRASV